MKITKLFEYENSHVVRNCSSKRCKYSIHGHSYKVEVTILADELDNGEMIYDFGLMKGTIKDLIDSFDHTHTIWDKESEEFKGFFHKFCARVIETPFSPSAEQQALFFCYLVDKVLKATEFNNGEALTLRVDNVRVWETRTGSATATMDDVRKLVNYDLKDIYISDDIKDEWKDPLMYDKLVNFFTYDGSQLNAKPFVNDVVEQQI